MSTFDEINQRFAEALRKIGVADTERAITTILIQVEGNTQPMIPRATGTLANSVFRRMESTGRGWLGTLGFGANYAAYVHEAPGVLMGTGTPRHPARLGTVWGPNGEPKYFEKGIEQTIPQLEAILGEAYRE